MQILVPRILKKILTNIIDNINDWFKVNSLLNFDNTYFLQFKKKISHEINIKISYKSKQIKEIKNARFLELDIDSSLSWKDHIDQMMFNP